MKFPEKTFYLKTLRTAVWIYVAIFLLSSLGRLNWYEKETFESSLKKVGNLRVIFKSEPAHETYYFSWLMPLFGKYMSFGPQKVLFSFNRVDEEPSSVRRLELFIHRDSKWVPLAINIDNPPTLDPKTVSDDVPFHFVPSFNERSEYLKVKYPGISLDGIADNLSKKGLTREHIDLYLSGVSDENLNSYYAPRSILISTVDQIPMQSEIQLKLEFDLVDSKSRPRKRMFFNLKKIRREGFRVSFPT